MSRYALVKTVNDQYGSVVLPIRLSAYFLLLYIGNGIAAGEVILLYDFFSPKYCMNYTN